MRAGLFRTLVLIFIALGPLPIGAGQSVRDNLQVFVGEITDSHCAKISVRAEFTVKGKAWGATRRHAR